ncbi:MAG: DUF4179 domain-containing protein [Clostridia bacterium]|nr:DUF4179 domain-containing protein [Clostridia bacterium]
MKESHFKAFLASSPENPPEVFHQRMESTLAEFIRQEEYEMRESTKKALKKGGLFSSRALVLAIILCLILGSVGIAASLGLFGELSGMPHEDKRLPALEQVSTPLNQSTTTEQGITATIQQAYYDGERVFVAYKLEGNRVIVEMGDGIPDVKEWSFEQDGMLYARDYDSALPEDEKIGAWLDGTTPRWAKRTATSPHDGLSLSDGTYLDIIGGTSYLQPDGSEIGWKECLIPKDKQTDTLEVNLMLFTGATTYYQDEKSMKWAYERIGENINIPFIVTKDDISRPLIGYMDAGTWQAKANVILNPVDVRGEIVVTCPETWVEALSAWESNAINPIVNWQLYDDNVRIEGHNLSGGYSKLSESQLTYSICFQHGNDTKHLKLVPVFLDGTIDTEHALSLEIPTITYQQRK